MDNVNLLDQTEIRLLVHALCKDLEFCAESKRYPAEDLAKKVSRIQELVATLSDG